MTIYLSGGPPLPTADEARWAGRRGWDLRCRRCGDFGATWQPGVQAGTDIALCDPHAGELAAERARHDAAMAKLTERRFAQPIPAPQLPSMAEDRRRRAAFEARPARSAKP